MKSKLESNLIIPGNEVDACILPRLLIFITTVYLGVNNYNGVSRQILVVTVLWWCSTLKYVVQYGTSRYYSLPLISALIA